MTGSAKTKGDRAEREAAAMIADQLGITVRRRLGAGRLDDQGDLEGIPGFVLQVANWADVARAAREKPLAAERQRTNAAAPFAATFVRFPGGIWRVVQTPTQFCDLVREAIA